jgi:hypothetical protein
MPRNKNKLKKRTNNSNNNGRNHSRKKASAFNGSSRSLGNSMAVQAPYTTDGLFSNTRNTTRLSSRRHSSGKEVACVSGTVSIGQLMGSAGTQGGFTTLSTSLTQIISVQPDSASFYNPTLGLISLAFSRYRFTKMIIRYNGVGTTTDATRCVFGYTDDACHTAYVQSTGSAVANLFTAILLSSNSVTFAPWSSWTMRLPIDPEQEFLYLMTNINSTTNISATQRQNFQGIFLCATTQNNSSTFGMFYLDYECELFDESAVGPLGSTLLSRDLMTNEDLVVKQLYDYCQQQNITLTSLLDKFEVSAQRQFPVDTARLVSSSIAPLGYVNVPSRMNDEPDRNTLFRSPQLPNSLRQ